jgi:hypothetical protein
MFLVVRAKEHTDSRRCWKGVERSGAAPPARMNQRSESTGCSDML